MNKKYMLTLLINTLLTSVILYGDREVDYTKYNIQKMNANEVGNYVVGSLDKTDITPKTWLKIRMQIEETNETPAQVTLLRPIWWFQQHKPKIKETMHISIPDIGVKGKGKVLAIEPCNVDSRKIIPTRKIIIGRFVHQNVKVWDLTFEDPLGNQKTLGVTAAHPIYSKDRKKWTTAYLLRLGEHVTAFHNNELYLKKRQKRKGQYRVYNIEFHRSHVFYFRKPISSTQKNK